MLSLQHMSVDDDLMRHRDMAIEISLQFILLCLLAEFAVRTKTP
jgi:hypothetical protein